MQRGHDPPQDLSSSRRLFHLLLWIDPADELSIGIVELDLAVVRKPHRPHIAAAKLIPHEIAIPKKDRAGDGFCFAYTKFSESGCHKLGNGVGLHGFVDAGWGARTVSQSAISVVAYSIPHAPCQICLILPISPLVFPNTK